MRRSKNTAFPVFYRFFWARNPLRMNTCKKSPQVLIIKDLLETSNPLESTLTKKGEVVGLTKKPGSLHPRASEIPCDGYPDYSFE